MTSRCLPSPNPLDDVDSRPRPAGFDLAVPQGENLEQGNRLPLHAPDGARLVGFDNAHPVRGRRGSGTRKREGRDHRHRLRTIQPYDYKDAATLLEDFWNEVDRVLKDRGSIP